MRFVREHLWKDAQLALDFTVVQAKRRYDNKHRQVEFQEGEQVLLKLYHSYSLPRKPNRKYS
jgi:hypothetical protein